MAITVIKGHSRLMARTRTTATVQGSSAYADIASVTEFNMIENTYWPADLNPSSGVFNNAGPVADLNYINGTSKYLAFQIPFKRTGFVDGVVPPWWGGVGVAYEDTTVGGAILRLWDSAIYTKWMDIWEQVYAALFATGHISKLAYVTTSESAATLSPFPAGFTTPIWDATLRQFASDMRTLFPNTVVIVPDVFSLVSESAFDAYSMSIDVGIGGADTVADVGDSRHAHHVLKSAHAGENAEAPIKWNVESGNYVEAYDFPADYPDATYAGQSSANDPPQSTSDYQTPDMMLNYLINTSKADIVGWLRRDIATGYNWAAVVAAVQAYGASGTGEFPPNYSSPPPVEPPASATGVTFKPIQTTLPTAGSPPVAHPVAHSLPAAAKLVFAHWNKATANETNTASGALGFGASDFTNQWAVALRANAANPTSTNMRGMTDKCLALMQSGSSSMDVEVDDGTPDATNINFSITDLPGSAYLAEMWAACGDGLQRCVATANLSTQDTAVPVTATDPTSGLTFQPNAAIVFTLNTTFNDTAASHAQWSKGIACIDPSATLRQKCFMFKDENAVSPSEPVSKLHTTRVGGIISTADAETFTVDIAFTSTGCTVTAKGGNGTGSAVGLVLMRIDPSYEQDLKDITFPTTTGDASFNVGGPVDFGVIVGTGLDTVDSIDTTNAGNFFISSFTPVSAALSFNTYEDAQTTADNRARASLKPIYMYSQDGATEVLKATYVSQSDPNVTFNFSTAPATAYKGFIWRIAKAGSLSGSSTAVTVPSTIDLTAAGYTDYVRLGTGGVATSIERKANGGGQIDISYDTPAGVFTGGSTNYPQLSATDAAPSGSLVASAARPYWTTLNDDVSITFPASQNSSTASVWVSASGVDVGVLAELSDGSAADYTTTLSSVDTTSGNIVRRRIDVAYQSVNPGETLTITLSLDAINAVGGNMSVQAAGIVNDYEPPVDNVRPTFPFGLPTLIDIVEDSPGAGTYTATVRVQLSEAGTVFGQARLATNTATPEPDQVEVGVDGNNSATDIDATAGPTDIDLFEEVILSYSGLAESTGYYLDTAARDLAGLYVLATTIIQITTPSPSTGGGGGEGPYQVTVLLDNGAGSTVNDTAVRYAWIDAADFDFDNATTLSGSWKSATSGPTGLLTIQRSTTDNGYLVDMGENGQFYRSTEQVPA